MKQILSPGIFVADLVPIVLILSAAYHQQRALRSVLIRRERESGMSDEMMKNLIGKRFTFSTFLFGETFKNVDVVEVDGNWTRLTDGKRERLVNGDYVTSVKIVGKAGERWLPGAFAQPPATRLLSRRHPARNPGPYRRSD